VSEARYSRRGNPVFGDEYAALRDVLKAARVSAGLTHRGLAARIGKHPSHVTKIECGQRRVDVLDLYLMAKALELEPASFFGQIAARIDALQPPAGR
jgi:transcriptional regulator with XRE-family HTH domain